MPPVDYYKTQYPASRITDELAGWWAVQWLSGISQKEIARNEGYKNVSTISTSIFAFLLRWAPEGQQWQDYLKAVGWVVYGDLRRTILKDAIHNFAKPRKN